MFISRHFILVIIYGRLDLDAFELRFRVDGGPLENLEKISPRHQMKSDQRALKLMLCAEFAVRFATMRNGAVFDFEIIQT